MTGGPTCCLMPGKCERPAAFRFRGHDDGTGFFFNQYSCDDPEHYRQIHEHFAAYSSDMHVTSYPEETP